MMVALKWGAMMSQVEVVQYQVLQYFAGEQVESILFIIAGVSAVTASFFLFQMPGTYRGITYPLVSIALVQLIVGSTVYLRSDSQVAALTQQLNSDPAAFWNSEISRMQTVMAWFRWYKIIEILFLALGILLTFVMSKQTALFGSGIGLIMQASLVLILDLFAERRGEQYMAVLQSFFDG